MRTITYTVTKMVLNDEERLLKKKWSKDWFSFVKKHNKKEKIKLVLGEWSGYNSSQRRIVHIDFADKYINEGSISLSYGKVEFSDKTYLDVYVKEYSLEDILREKIYPKISYDSVIKEMIKSGKNYYKIQ